MKTIGLIKIILDELNIKQFRMKIGVTEEGDLCYVSDGQEDWIEVGERVVDLPNSLVGIRENVFKHLGGQDV